MKNQIILSAIALASMGFAATEADAQFYIVKDGQVVFGLDEGTVDYVTAKTPTGLDEKGVYYVKLIDANGEVRKQALQEVKEGSNVYFADVENVTETKYYYSYNDGEATNYFGKAADEKYSKTTNFAQVTNFEVTPFEGITKFVLDLNEGYKDSRTFTDIVNLPNGWMWIVGNGTEVDWNPVSNAGMFTIENPREPWVYSWTGQFYKNQFKVGLGNDGWGGSYFFASEYGVDPLVDNSLREPRGEHDDIDGDGNEDGDSKWVSTVEGKYKLTFYIRKPDLHLTFTPVEGE